MHVILVINDNIVNETNMFVKYMLKYVLWMKYMKKPPKPGQILIELEKS